MRHVWSGMHDGCDACVVLWPTKTITAREALERWPARSARKRKAIPTPSPRGSRQHRGKALDGQKLAHKKSRG